MALAGAARKDGAGAAGGYCVGAGAAGAELSGWLLEPGPMVEESGALVPLVVDGGAEPVSLSMLEQAARPRPTATAAAKEMRFAFITLSHFDFPARAAEDCRALCAAVRAVDPPLLRPRQP